MSIGSNIKLYRKQAKLTQAELASRANMSRSYLADLEADRYNPSVDTLKTVADALGTRIHLLLGEKQDEFISKEFKNTIPEWASEQDVLDIKHILENNMPIKYGDMTISEELQNDIRLMVMGRLWKALEEHKKEKK